MKRILHAVLLGLLQASPAAAAADSQSLADAARKEAERRQKVDQQGVAVKRIDAANPSQSGSGGAISVSSPASRPSLANAPAPKTEPRASLRSFQTRLQKLDRDILQAEERIKLLQGRVAAERWAPVKTAKGSRGSGASSSQEQLRQQILELEGRLAILRKDRSDTFLAGRRAGYLPGELENRGIVR
jgi:hypothetical protein